MVTPPTLTGTNDSRDHLILPQRNLFALRLCEHFDSMMLKCFSVMKRMPFSHSRCSTVAQYKHFGAIILISVGNLQDFGVVSNNIEYELIKSNSTQPN